MQRLVVWIAVLGIGAALSLDRVAVAEPPDLSRYSLGNLPYDSYTAGRALQGSRNPMPGETARRPPVVVQPIVVGPPVYVPVVPYNAYRPYWHHPSVPPRGLVPYYGVPRPVYGYPSQTMYYRSQGLTVIWTR